MTLLALLNVANLGRVLCIDVDDGAVKVHEEARELDTSGHTHGCGEAIHVASVSLLTLPASSADGHGLGVPAPSLASHATMPPAKSTHQTGVPRATAPFVCVRRPTIVIVV
jgi:hypothetical protein